jgi:hypothetical protein
VSSNIRLHLNQELRLGEVTIAYVHQGTLPKTSSGKLQRNRFRSLWLEKKISALHVDAGLWGG